MLDNKTMELLEKARNHDKPAFEMLVEHFTPKLKAIARFYLSFDQDIEDIIKNKMSMGLVKVENTQEYGLVETKGKKVVKIYEKMQDPFTNVINAGILMKGPCKVKRIIRQGRKALPSFTTYLTFLKLHQLWTMDCCYI